MDRSSPQPPFPPPIPGVDQRESIARCERAIRESVEQLRGADPTRLAELARAATEKRLAWFAAHQESLDLGAGTVLDRAYRLFLAKLGIPPDEAPIVARRPDRIVIHSMNPCPTLEACRILDLDTRYICAVLTEAPMAALLRCFDPRLRFARNYERLRPFSGYCEEMIILEE